MFNDYPEREYTQVGGNMVGNIYTYIPRYSLICMETCSSS